MADEIVKKQMLSNSTIKTAVRMKGLIVECVELDDDSKGSLIEAKKRQDITA